MAKIISAKTLVEGHVTASDTVLLVNPPVEDTRYSWLRWNQPSDLLKIASFLRSEVGCDVQLFDYMQPNSKGKVLFQRLPGERQNKHLGGERYPMRRYGLPYRALRGALAEGSVQKPSHVWITSLCSYWFPSVAQVCREVRQVLPEAQIALLGNYARLLPKHAAETCPATFVVSKTLDLTNRVGALDLYETPPPFVALSVADPSVAAAEAAQAVERGVHDFALFDEDILFGAGARLRELLARTEGLHKHFRIHILCGLDPRHIDENTAPLLGHRSVASLNLEEASSSGHLDLEAYRSAVDRLDAAGRSVPAKNVSGFAWIGRPREDLEALIVRACHVLQFLGNVVFKPYTPTPGDADAVAYADYLQDRAYQDWSPHFFPFSELNDITRSDYSDLYRLSAFLNEKVRSRSFDFLAGTLGADFLRESLRREVWKLEPSRTFKAPKRRTLRTLS